MLSALGTVIDQSNYIQKGTSAAVIVTANIPPFAKEGDKIESAELVSNIKQINETVAKIISTVEKKPEKYKVMSNFFNYYLPVTLNILTRYDEIENQRLTTEDSKKFMKSAEDMIKNINEAFKKQLSNLYQSDMIDTDAEMKVFNAMLKSDGFDDGTEL